MKRFLSTLAIWAVLMLIATFFFAAFFWGHVYRIALLLAAVCAVLTQAFLSQAERIDRLEERLKALEEQTRQT